MNKIILVIVMCMIFTRSSYCATWWLGVDGGINSYLGFISEIHFLQERLCAFMHLDIENKKGGSVVLSYKIPAKIVFIPAGVALIGGGDKNNLEMSFGVYAGIRFDIKNIMFYLNSYYTPKKFEHRRLQNFNVEAGISFAIIEILRSIFSDEQTSE